MLRTFFRCTVFGILLVIAAVACRTAPQAAEIKFPTGELVTLLDSTAAAAAITTDTKDNFFELITLSEMSIQMKKEIAKGETREMRMPSYLTYLRKDVESFTPKEAKFVRESMEWSYQQIAKLGPNIMPTHIRMIKTKGNHYGDGVYYTRENDIVIPQDALTAADETSFRQTMLHEIFHIYSRYNLEKRTALYGLIGFKAIPPKFKMPAEVSRVVLYNPDGVAMNWAITLKQKDGTTIQAIPVIYANHEGYTTSQKTFFSYLQFELFEVKKHSEIPHTVVCKPDGKSTLEQPNYWSDFSRQIKENTDYIIHPDEIMADNFTYVVNAANNPASVNKFNAEGQKLLTDIKAILLK